MTILSENLKILRKKYNLTQLDVANQLGIGRTTYLSYEKGTNEPNINLLIKLSNLFSITIDELLSKNTCNIISQYSYPKLETFDKNIFNKSILIENLKNKKIFLQNSLDEFSIEVPKKIKEIDEILKFLESNSQENNNLKNTKTDTEFSSELSIDLKNLSDEKTSKEKNIDDYSNKKKSVKIPVYDLPISAGVPKYSEEPVIDELRTLELKRPLTEDNLEEFYILKVSGDSMNNIVDDGEEILIQGTNCVENGEIAAVTLLNDSDSTIKYYYRHGNEIILKPNSSNPKHHTQKYNLDEEEILVQGRYIGKVKDYLIQSERD